MDITGNKSTKDITDITDIIDIKDRALIEDITDIRTVTDSVGKMCVEPGETGTTLQAGGDRGPGPPVGEKGGRLASASGKRRTGKNSEGHRRRALHNIKLRYAQSECYCAL